MVKLVSERISIGVMDLIWHYLSKIMCLCLDISSLMLLLSCYFLKKCGLWETMLFLWSFVYLLKTCKNLVLFLQWNVRLSKERGDQSLFLWHLQKNLRISTNKTNSRNKIKWIFTCFETSALVYLSCLAGNFFIHMLFKILMNTLSSHKFRRDISNDVWIGSNGRRMRKLLLFEVLEK